ncbi:MAG: hypothetical protein O2783_00690 [Chloroflexi bacterium]|nr:hypothetical protein [Chloroflexota bacterium]
MAIEEVVGYVQLTLQFEREGNKWVGTCTELSTSTFARTLKQCQEALSALVIEHLNCLEEEGERPAFFKKWNIEIHPTRTTPSTVTIRGVGADWNQLFRGGVENQGPLFQPRLFSIGSGIERHDRELAGV